MVTGTNHVSINGKYPAAPQRSFMHHLTSHRIRSQSFFDASHSGTSADASLHQLQKTVVPSSEKFNRTGAGPIKGLWAKPA